MHRITIDSTALAAAFIIGFLSHLEDLHEWMEILGMPSLAWRWWNYAGLVAALLMVMWMFYPKLKAAK